MIPVNLEQCLRQPTKFQVPNEVESGALQGGRSQLLELFWREKVFISEGLPALPVELPVSQAELRKCKSGTMYNNFNLHCIKEKS